MRDPIIAASRLEPQSRLTVVAGSVTGSPDSSTAIRPTLRLSSPAPFALPQYDVADVLRVEVRHRGQHPAHRRGGQVVRADAGSPPLNLPNGVRTAA